jgi:hypothetical protein
LGVFGTPDRERATTFVLAGIRKPAQKANNGGPLGVSA